MKPFEANRGTALEKLSTESPSYQVGWLVALFAAHSNYDALALADNGVLLHNGKSRQRISYLSIGKGIALEPGFFWDVLAIHLENGKVIRVGGVSKKQSLRLQTGLNRAVKHFLTEFYQRIVPEMQAASRQACVLFSGNRYIRKAVARQ
jgi:DNA helicase-4